jgi:hypothetical protein
MARNSRNKAAGPRHVRIHHYMMATPAWKSLGCTERAMYVDIAARYAGLGTNNGKIGYSVRDAAANLHIGKSTATRALKILQDRGFIVPVKVGAFTLKQRHASEWRLTEFASDVSNDIATKDFMTWTPDKNKTRYPERHRTVPVAAPIGTPSGPMQDSNTSHGTYSGPVNGGLAA